MNKGRIVYSEMVLLFNCIDYFLQKLTANVRPYLRTITAIK